MSETLVNPSATVDSAIDAVLARARVAYSAEHAERVARAVTFVNASAKIGERLKMVQRALDVALLLLDIEVDEATVVAAVLALSIPEKDRDDELWTGAFGDEVIGLVRGLARAGKIETLSGRSNDAAATESLRKMLLAMADDVRVILIKLAERAIYLRSITKADEAVRRAAAITTRDLFAPLANRLGIWQIKWEMEDLSFRFLEPDTYKQIARLLDEKRVERESHVEQVRHEMRVLGGRRWIRWAGTDDWVEVPR
jgi:GTP pyrophosphokinase